MSRSKFIILLLFFIIILGFGTRNRGILSLALPLIIYLGYALFFFKTTEDIVIHRSIQPLRGDQSTLFNISLSIKNQGNSIGIIHIHDNLPEGLEIVRGYPDILASLPNGKNIQLNYSVRGRRALYNFKGITLSAYDPLVTIRSIKFQNAEGKFYILPDSSRLKKINILPKQTQLFTGIVPSRAGGQGVEFYGVREYQFGDSLPRINWKITSRQGDRLYTNEYRQERVAEIRIILDARARVESASTSISIFEHSVMAAASIADILIREGNQVGLLIYGKYLDITQAGYGKIQRERLIRALSRASPGYSPVFNKLDYFPARFLPMESQIILISPLEIDDLRPLLSLGSRGYHVIIVSPDPIRFRMTSGEGENQMSPHIRIARLERRMLFFRLLRAGIMVFNWDTSQNLDQIIGRKGMELRPYPLRVIP
jgi:uncharacterized protein (DUF58 family)